MLHFRLNMPLSFMMLYGSMMLLLVLALRCLLKKRLPGYVFPLLWGLVIVRFLVPFSISSPLSMKVPDLPLPLIDSASVFSSGEYATTEISAVEITEDIPADASLPSTSTENPSMTVSPAAGASTAETIVSQTADNTLESLAENDITISGTFPGSSPKAYSFQVSDTLPFFYRDSLLYTLAPIVYFLGVLVTAGLLFLQKRRYSGKLKDRLLVEQNETINTLLREMHMAHILVFTNDEIASPLVCGLFTPRIYLPARMDFRNTELLRHILAHETMHIRRRDNWIKAAMLPVLCLNWFNPLVWLMARCLAADLETACDEAVLRSFQEEDMRKGYAFSLLAMAVSAGRSPLLYSAFSRTEVEKRIQRVLSFKKASAFLILVVSLLLACGTVVCATGGQAPFDSYLSSTCYHGDGDSRWAFKAWLTRDIALGKDPGKRADDTILSVLKADTTGDPDRISERIKEALAEEFHVEKSAFAPVPLFCIDPDTAAEEYAAWGLTRDENGMFLYQGNPAGSFTDELNRIYQSNKDGRWDITVHRDRLGYISSVTALEDGVVVRLVSDPEEADKPQ